MLVSEKPLGLAAMEPWILTNFKRQLRSLKRCGLTPETVKGGTLSYLQRWFGATSARGAHEMLCTALNAMDRGEIRVQALLNAYDGDGSTINIKVRRRNFADKYELTEARVIELEDLAIDEMVEILDLLTRGESPLKSSLAETPVKELLFGLIKAVEDQTAVLREISIKLDRE